MKNSNLPNTILEHIPWDSNSNPIWPASSFLLHRNIAKYPFPSKLSETQSSQLVPHLQSLILGLSELTAPTYLPAETLSPQEKEFLSEHFLSQDCWQNASKGQGFIIDASSHFLATFNMANHLALQWVDCKGLWEQAWNTLNRIETAIGAQTEYAFSPQFGYLTSLPDLCGTSLVVLCYLHVPALIFSEKLEDALEENVLETIKISSFSGGTAEFIGDFIILQNKLTLGLSEEMILSNLYTLANHLVLAEKNERLLIQASPPLPLKDKISRAYGLLLHSYQLETKEALNALSQIKLGIDLGWIQGINDQEINELLFRCRRAHLVQSNEKISLHTKDLSEARSAYLHEKLQKTTLQF